VMLEYRPKCRDYMASVGQEHATVRTDEFDAKKVWETVEHFNTNRMEFTKSLYQAIKPVADAQRTKAGQVYRQLISK
ncbi:MAG: hypothetical protein KAS23_11625, partial [Anaerohalosphaera sp.]|nr:hypothetical protein [Anaerohalosphaera sp.]